MVECIIGNRYFNYRAEFYSGYCLGCFLGKEST